MNTTRYLSVLILLIAGCFNPDDTSPIASTDGATDGDSGNADATEGEPKDSDGPDDEEETNGTNPEEDCTPDHECIDDDDCYAGESCLETCVCSDSDESESDGDSDTNGAPACKDLGDCQECVNCSTSPGGDCEDPAQSCFDSPPCAALVRCQNMCADQACVEQCVADHPEGEAGFFALLECVSSACDGVC
jgi:hypothetical protein